MKINEEAVKELEALAKIELTEAERARAAGELQNILSFCETLGELDTEDAVPAAHTFPAVNVMRADIVTNAADVESVLRNAPHSRDGCFVVPKTVE